ncbi:MAG: cyclic nucleotide-binding domain-containing protein [Deltaproteobacteria bacterium]|nr:cyclic nucleotide-binding domain-containing protein [Deltaproteobacteria bacterium]
MIHPSSRGVADSHLRRYGANEVLFEAGTMATEAYVLKEGEVEISIRCGESKLVLDTVGPGEVFGEMALLLKDPHRTATCVALVDSTVVVLDKQLFRDCVSQASPLVATLLAAFSERLRKTTEKLLAPRDLFLSTCEMLNLLASQGLEELSLEDTVRGLAKALFVDEARVRETFELLESMCLLVVQESQEQRKVIRFAERKEFLAKALRISRLLGRIGK